MTVKESPEEVARKVLEWRLAMNFKDNEPLKCSYAETFLKLAGLEVKHDTN
ncbi:hypothetical protein [Gordoniibacillus kamchatkensis]|uniref:hypothetical protein n=1 Tax=Gordoniibacillus kamchatkensis TaxID=1590651 RepID=UPI0012E09E19|nr:hypothetical protein [Paenibacillus sp. VKM B-2647]